MSIETWLRQVPDFGLNAVEIYHGFITPENRPQVKRLLDDLEISVSQLTCAPDFTNPDPAERERQLEEMKAKVETAAELGAQAVRVTAGMRHEGLSQQKGVELAVESMVRLLEFSEPRGVKLCYENHYQDRRWSQEDFSFRTEVFLQIFERLEPTAVMVNFDFANPLMAGADGAALLKRVAHKVFHVHAGDRVPGVYQHCVLGTGGVDFDTLLSILKQHGYAGYLTIEDGQAEGDEGFRRSVAFLKERLEAVYDE